MFGFDLALLKTRRKSITYSKSVQPVNLPLKRTWVPRTLTSVGWGQDENGQYPGSLKEVLLNIIGEHRGEGGFFPILGVYFENLRRRRENFYPPPRPEGTPLENFPCSGMVNKVTDKLNCVNIQVLWATSERYNTRNKNLSNPAARWRQLYCPRLGSPFSANFSPHHKTEH